MRKFLLFIALALSQFSSSAQNLTITLPDTLVGKQWVKNYVRSVLKDAAGVPGGEIKDPDPGTGTPGPTLTPCKIGPELEAAYSITDRSLIGQFHGEEVFEISWTITDAEGKPVRSGSVSPANAQPLIKFDNPLAPGNYTLIYEGKSCISKPSLFPFIVPKQSGEVVTPPEKPLPEEPSTGSGTGKPLPLITLTQGMDEHMRLVFRDSAGVRLMSDMTDDNRDDKNKYLYRYLIGSDKVDTDSRLKNYVVAGNNPLRVLLGKLDRQWTKEGFNKWAGTPEEAASGWFKVDAGEPFSYHTSYAFNTFVTAGAQEASGFLNHVPQGYDPSNQQVSWGEIGENIQLPKGHFWGANWYPWGVDKVFSKGVTHLPHHSLPWNEADDNAQVKALKAAGKTFSNYQRIEAVFGRGNNGRKETWPNGTSKAVWPTPDGLPADEAREWAWKTDASDAIWLSEMSENVGWQPGGSPLFANFYPELRKRYEQNFGQRGIPYEIIHNYFWMGGESLNSGQSADYYKQLFTKEPKDLPQTEYSPGAPLSATTMIVEAVYLRAPDQFLRQPTELAFRLEYFKHMGYHAGVVLFGQGETRPNNRYRLNFPDGTYYKEDKFPLDPNVHIASLFFGHVYGNATFEWGGFGWANQKLFDGRPGQLLKGDWFPLGSKEPRNNEFNKLWAGSGDFYHGFTGSADLTYFAHRLYAKTFGITDGGERKYLRFRIDGGVWIEPENFKAHDLISAYKQQRGFVFSQSKDGKVAWFYHNSFADNKPHTLEVVLPTGQIVKQFVAGNGIHAKIQ